LPFITKSFLTLRSLVNSDSDTTDEIQVLTSPPRSDSGRSVGQLHSISFGRDEGPSPSFILPLPLSPAPSPPRSTSSAPSASISIRPPPPPTGGTTFSTLTSSSSSASSSSSRLAHSLSPHSASFVSSLSQHHVRSADAASSSSRSTPIVEVDQTPCVHLPSPRAFSSARAAGDGPEPSRSVANGDSSEADRLRLSDAARDEASQGGFSSNHLDPVTTATAIATTTTPAAAAATVATTQTQKQTSHESHKTPNVYINGLPPYFPEEQLYALTAPFGSVRSVRTFTRHVGERVS
jgi:hypothetical protein